MQKALLILPFLFTGSAFAQSLSVSDLRAQIDAELNKGNEYAELLNDPDPARAQAAMKLMLESGDAELVKVALEYGLYSPDAAVRAKAVKAFFDSSPTIEMTFDVSKSKDRSKTDGFFSGNYNSAYDESGKAVVIRKIIGFDEGSDCYTTAQWNGREKCQFRLSRQEIQFSANEGNWHRMRLNDAGVLEVDYVIFGQDVDVSIPIQ